jgi:molybdate transport system substrate-binding protein
VKETRKSLLGNSLVIVTPPDSAAIQSPADLTNAAVKRVALGDPRLFPPGLTQSVSRKIRVVGGDRTQGGSLRNVRAVLAAVESGNVDAGVVYKTDAAISKKVRVAFEVPCRWTENSYPAALVERRAATGGRKKVFGLCLAGSEAGAVFARHGFVVLSPPVIY